MPSRLLPGTYRLRGFAARQSTAASGLTSKWNAELTIPRSRAEGDPFRTASSASRYPSYECGGMARRGLIAQILHNAKVAAREREREARRSQTAYASALRRREQARKADERARAKMERADEAERKRLAKEAKEAHIEEMEAEAERMTLEVEEQLAEIDGLLAATLEVDDYVDLNMLRPTLSHPRFEPKDPKTGDPLQVPDVDPPPPPFRAPAEPTGLRKLFGRGAHAKAVAAAQEKHSRQEMAWRVEVSRLKKVREEIAKQRAAYESECAQRVQDAKRHNESIDTLITNLSYGSVEAVHEYLTIVLSNSAYPSHFSVEHDFTFAPATAELKLRVEVPAPDRLPTAKAFKYSKRNDAIAPTALPAKACKDRYASAVHQVALRTLHEVFEADRRGLIGSISLEVGTQTVHPATGRSEFILFVAVAAEREAFLKFDLGQVVPAATLSHLGAAVSKNPFDLVAANPSGIRRA